MADFKLKWHGPQAKASIESEFRRRLAACCLVLVNHARTLIDVDGTGVVAKSSKAKGKKKAKRKGSLIYGAYPSKPGEPPHKQRGRLLGSVAFEVKGLIARVGTNVKYGRWLELGTKHMAARPWLRRALRECWAQLKAILEGGH